MFSFILLAYKHEARSSCMHDHIVIIEHEANKLTIKWTILHTEAMLFLLIIPNNHKEPL